MRVAAIALTATLLGIGWGLWNGALAKSILAASLSRTLGGAVSIDTFGWQGWGRAVLKGVTLTAPAWNAPGAQVARVSEVRLQFDPGSLFAGPLLIRDVEITGLALTFVDDPARGSIYNVQTLTPSAIDRDEAGEPAAIVERARIEAFTIAFERLKDSATQPMAAYSASLTIAPSATHPTRSEFALEESESDDPIRLAGWIDQQTLAFEIDAHGLALTKNLALILPGTIRAVAESSEATGKITAAHLGRDARGQYSGTMEFEAVSATLPNHLLGRWVRYERGQILKGQGFPRFELDRGAITVQGSTVAIRDVDVRFVSTNADGGVATLPVHASLTTDFGLFQRAGAHFKDREAWLEALKQSLPFELAVSVSGFVLGKSAETAAIELPEAAARFLKTFNIEEMEFDLGYSARRAEPKTSAGGLPEPTAIETSGTLVITNGKGAFAGFPYPLDKVSATVRFLGDEVEIADLRGISKSGDGVLMVGKVTNIVENFGVDLKISAASAPIDSALIDCFPPAMRTFLGSLFWREGFQRLREAGLLAGTDEVRAAEREVFRLEPQIAALTLDEATTASELASVALRLGAMKKILARGAFEPGGRAAFTLRVTKSEEAKVDISVTGSIRILEGNFLPRLFPYPWRANAGEITVLEDRVDFGAGIDFTTLEGAHGQFRGSLHVTNEGGTPGFRPELKFTLDKESVNPLLVMAIPPADGSELPGWPGEAWSEGGKILSLLDIRGEITVDGAIGSSREDAFDVQCELTLDRGSLHPHLADDDPLDSGGLLWPSGFGLDDCHAQVTVTDEKVTVAAFTGLRGHGLIEANGFASLVDESQDLEVRLRHVDLSDYAVNLVPYRERRAARELWARYRPTGVFDADLRVFSTAHEPTVITELEVRPRALGLTLPEGPIGVEFDSGALSVQGTSVTCNALEGRIHPFPARESRVCLDGTYGGSGAFDLAGSVERGLIESPATRELLRIFGGDSAIAALNEFDPQGRFDATFSYTTPGPDAPGRFIVDAFVDELALGDRDGRLALSFDPPAHVHANTHDILLHPTDARFVGGTASAAGWMSATPSRGFDRGLFAFDVTTSGSAADLIAALPPPARQPLRSMGFESPDLLIAHAEYSLAPLAGASMASLDASVLIQGGRLTAEPGIDRLDATIDIGLRATPSAHSFTVASDDARLRIAHRPIEHARIRIGTSPLQQDRVDLSLTGALGTGNVEIDASIASAPPYPYSSDVRLAGCDLLTLTVRGDGVSAGTAPAAPGDPGIVDARFGIGGDDRGVATRRGRGSAVVHKVDLARLPIALAILQVAQASFSFDPTVDTGIFDFTIDGSSLFFERFALACEDLTLDGGGWLDTESGELALRLRNRGTTPILSDLLGGVANQLFQIDVRGTLADPKGSLAPLPGIVPPPVLSTSPAAGALR